VNGVNFNIKSSMIDCAMNRLKELTAMSIDIWLQDYIVNLTARAGR